MNLNLKQTRVFLPTMPPPPIPGKWRKLYKWNWIDFDLTSFFLSFTFIIYCGVLLIFMISQNFHFKIEQKKRKTMNRDLFCIWMENYLWNETKGLTFLFRMTYNFPFNFNFHPFVEFCRRNYSTKASTWNHENDDKEINMILK